MKICVINGSPKGKYSVSLQTILYLQKIYKDCEFDILNVAQKIKYYEKNFDECIEAIQKADLIIFVYPVYILLVPAQLHKFIALLKEKKLDLSEKFATQFSTSKHFYDSTAHKFIEQNCYDLGLKYVKGLSADMDDLLTTKGQNDAKKFFKFVSFSVNNDIYELPKTIEYFTTSYDRVFQNIEKTDKYNTIILTDMRENETNLQNMIDDFRAVYPYESKVINIADYPFSGGCLGCMNCSASGVCIYKDGFTDFLRNDILKADAVIYAFTIKDHSMGHYFKLYEDRQFCNGHRMLTMGMPVGYLVSGNYEAETNLQLFIDAKAEVGHNYLSGVTTNSKSMQMMVNKLVYSLNNKYHLPQNFLGVGGRKIFRDLVYVMRGISKADHKFYKEVGVYDDLPQKHKGKMFLMLGFGALMNNPKLRKKIAPNLNEAIITPYQRVINEAE